MTYNETIEDKDSLLRILTPLFSIDFSGNHLELEDVEVTPPNLSYFDSMIRGESYNYTIKCICKVTSGSLAGKIVEGELYLPKFCERGFLIRSSTGKVNWISPINLGEITRPITSFMDNNRNTMKLRFRGAFTIDLGQTSNDDGTIIPARINLSYDDYNEEGKFPRYILTDYISHYGRDLSDILPQIQELPEELISDFDDYSTDYQPIDLGKNFDIINRKFYYLVGRELRNNSVDGTDLYDLIETYLNNPTKFKDITPFDVHFMNFKDYIFGKVTRKIASVSKRHIAYALTKSLTTNGDISYIPTKTINSEFARAMWDSQNSFGSQQFGSLSNAVSFASQTNKIYFNKFDSRVGGRVKVHLVYTKDFFGIICPSKTPENVSACNIKNELASDAFIDEGQVYIKLRSRSGQIVTLSYFDYFKSKVLSTSNYDYETNKVIPDEEGNVDIFSNGKYTKVPYSENIEFDYIRESPEGALSFNASLIPFVNRCDGVRISMATNMLDQAIPVRGGRPSVVGTRAYDNLYSISDLNYKSPVDGTVTAVYENRIKITDSQGNDYLFSGIKEQSSYSHTYNRTTPCVEVGQVIHKGDVIIESDTFKNHKVALTVPLRVGYFYYDEMTDEDAIVISETASRKLSHLMTKTITIEIQTSKKFIFNKDEVIKELNLTSKLDKLNQFGLPIIGETFNYDDLLSLYMSEADENSLRYKLSKITTRKVRGGSSDALAGTNDVYQVNSVRLPVNYRTARVDDVRFYCKDRMKHDPNVAQIMDYYDTIKSKKLSDAESVLGSGNYPMKERTLRNRRDDDPDIVIEIDISSWNDAKKGDKIANRYGSKGTISLVIPDELMPRIGGKDGTHLELIMSPNSCINRKNMAAQYIEQNLGEICRLAYSKNDELIKNSQIDQVRENLNALYVTDKFKSMDESEVIKFHSHFKEFYEVLCNSLDRKYTMPVMEELSNRFGYSLDGYDIYRPDIGRFLQHKVICGTTEMIRLHFIVENKSKATSALDENNELVMRLGSTRSGGQRIGQYEGWAVHAYGINKHLDRLLDEGSNDTGLAERETANKIITAMSLIGLQFIGADKD